jgi:hypothetical protein
MHRTLKEDCKNKLLAACSDGLFIKDEELGREKETLGRSTLGGLHTEEGDASALAVVGPNLLEFVARSKLKLSLYANPHIGRSRRCKPRIRSEFMAWRCGA